MNGPLMSVVTRSIAKERDENDPPRHASHVTAKRRQQVRHARAGQGASGSVPHPPSCRLPSAVPEPSVAIPTACHPMPAHE